MSLRESETGNSRTAGSLDMALATESKWPHLYFAEKTSDDVDHLEKLKPQSPPEWWILGHATSNLSSIHDDNCVL